MKACVALVLTALALSGAADDVRRPLMPVPPAELQSSSGQVLLFVAQPGPGDTPAGADVAAATGSAALPFASIHDARDHIRALRRRSPGLARSFKVAIGPGVYPPLHLEPQDSGSPGTPARFAFHAPVVPLAPDRPQDQAALPLHEHGDPREAGEHMNFTGVQSPFFF